jgi:hypothetical protein
MGAVGSAVGGLVSGGLGLLGGRQTNSAAAANQIAAQSFSDAQVQRMMDYNTEMSNTAVQRGTRDLIAAGINPILAAGHPASTPSGGAATGTAAPVVNALGNAMEAGISNFSALQTARQLSAQIDKIHADTAQSVAQTALAAEQTSKLKSGSVASNVVGTTAASKLSGLVNSAADKAASHISGMWDKAADLVDHIRGSSAASLEALSKRATTPLFKAASRNLSQLIMGNGLPSSASSDEDAYYRDFLINGGM